jgi:hypothetical protein
MVLNCLSRHWRDFLELALSANSGPSLPWIDRHANVSYAPPMADFCSLTASL